MARIDEGFGICVGIYMWWFGKDDPNIGTQNKVEVE